SVLVAQIIGCSRKCAQLRAQKLRLVSARLPIVRWTREELNELRRLWPTTSCSLIAEELGKSTKSVQVKARRLDLPHRGIPSNRLPAHRTNLMWRDQEQIERIKQLRLQGKMFNQIAALEGVTRGVVSGIIFRLGLTTKREPASPIERPHRAVTAPTTELLAE